MGRRGRDRSVLDCSFCPTAALVYLATAAAEEKAAAAPASRGAIGYQHRRTAEPHTQLSGLSGLYI